MKKLPCVLLAASAFGFSLSQAAAYTPDDVVVSDWARSAADTAAEDARAVCVVDFGAVSYAFGYAWEAGDAVTRPASTFAGTFGATADAATGEAMLLCLDDQTGLDVGYHYHDTLGFAADSFGYAGQSIASDGWVTTYLGYWISGAPAWDEQIWAQDGEGNWYLADTIHHDAVPGDGENWTPSGFGAAGRVLEDGFFDGWSQESVASGYTPVNVPTTPTPEPGTMAVLCVGVAGLLGRRRTRRTT